MTKYITNFSLAMMSILLANSLEARPHGYRHGAHEKVIIKEKTYTEHGVREKVVVKKTYKKSRRHRHYDRPRHIVRHNHSRYDYGPRREIVHTRTHTTYAPLVTLPVLFEAELTPLVIEPMPLTLKIRL